MSLLKYAIIFAVLAIVAGILGFGSLSGVLASFASTLFWVFILLFVLLIVLGFINANKRR